MFQYSGAEVCVLPQIFGQSNALLVHKRKIANAEAITLYPLFWNVSLRMDVEAKLPALLCVCQSCSMILRIRNHLKKLP